MIYIVPITDSRVATFQTILSSLEELRWPRGWRATFSGGHTVAPLVGRPANVPLLVLTDVTPSSRSRPVGPSAMRPHRLDDARFVYARRLAASVPPPPAVPPLDITLLAGVQGAPLVVSCRVDRTQIVASQLVAQKQRLRVTPGHSVHNGRRACRARDSLTTILCKVTPQWGERQSYYTVLVI